MKEIKNQVVEWWEEISVWWKKQTRRGKTITLFVCSVSIVLFLCFTDVARNLILLVAGIVGWHFLFRRTEAAEREANISERNIEITERSLKLAEENARITEQNRKDSEKNITNERINLATEQLASEKPSVRLSGILGLVKIFQFHKEERYRIIRVLSAFVHDFAPIDSDTRTVQDRSKYSDIEEAVQALAFLTEPFPADQKKTLFDLQFTNLSGLGFAGINLSYFNLLGVNFSNSHLYGVNFTDTRLGMVNFSGVYLHDPEGLTQEQLEQAFFWKGNPPRDFPSELKLTEKDPDKEKKNEDSTEDNSD